MLTKEMKIGITETVEILKKSSKEELEKIPEDFIKFLKKNVYEDYKFSINDNKNISDLELKKETKNILAYIAYNYWCKNKEQKEYIKEILLNNKKECDEKLKEKYNVDNLHNIKQRKNEKNSVAIIESKEGIIRKFINMIKRLIKKDKKDK